MVAAPTPHHGVVALKQQGDKAYAARDFKLAIQHYSEALESVEDASVLSNRSAAHAQRRAFEKARSDAERTLKLQPDWPRAYHRLGHALFHLGQYSEALQTFRKGLALDSGDKLLSEALSRAGEYTELNPDAPPPAPRRTRRKKKREARADGSGGAAPKGDSQNAAMGGASGAAAKGDSQKPAQTSAPVSGELRALDLEGEWMYGTQGKSYRITRGSDGLRYAGPHTRCGEVFGTLKLLQGQSQKVEAPLSSAEGELVGYIRLNVTEPGKTLISNYRAKANTEWGKDIIAHKGAPPTADELRDQGNALFRAGKHAAAMRAYSDAITMNSRDFKSYSNRAAAQMALLNSVGGRLTPDEVRKNAYYDSAMGDLQECLSLDPTFIKAWARKGQLLYMGGDVKGALAAYQRGLQVDPASADCQAGKSSCEKWLWG